MTVVGVVLELKDGCKVKYSVLRVYKMVREVIRIEGTERISLRPTIEPPVFNVGGPFLGLWGLERP